VQRQLSNSLALIQVESPRVAEKYEALVRQLREVAGGEIRRSWELPPIPAEAGQSIEDIDLSRLLPYERAYLKQVRKHLRPLPG
jgi:hypothetical protein